MTGAGDGHGVIGGADAVNIAGRRDSGYVASDVGRHSEFLQPDVMAKQVPLFLLGTLQDPEDTPCDVVVDWRGLPRSPDERDDRERAVSFRVQQMAAVAVRITGELLGRKDVRRR